MHDDAGRPRPHATRREHADTPRPSGKRPRTLGGPASTAHASHTPLRLRPPARSLRIAIHCFGEHRFDSTSGRLERAGRPIALRPRAAALLADLIVRRSRRVTRDELARRVWGGRAVTPSSFSTLIAELRRALGDDGRRQAVIETVGRDGYRFVAPVRIEGRADCARERADHGCEPFAEHVHEAAEAHLAAGWVPAHEVADRSLQAALGDGPRHLDVTGAGCDAFVDDWARTAHDRGWAVHRGHGLDEDAPTLWPWWQISTSILESIGSADDAPRPGDRSTGALRALWQRVRVEISAMTCTRQAGAGDRQRRFALCDDLSRALRRSALSRPLALTLEVPQGLDPDTRRLLRFLLLHTDRRALWIVTASPAPGGWGCDEPLLDGPRTDRIRLLDGWGSAAR